MRFALFALLCLALPAPAQTLVVVNQGDTTVSLVDPVTAHTLATIAERTPEVHAHEAATSLDGRLAYLPVYGSTGVGKPGIDGHELLVLDIATRTITARLDFGHPVRPHLPILDANTGLLYVTTELDKSITIIDPKTLKIVGFVPTGQEQSHMLVLSHDGRIGYTANVGPGTVSVLDMRARKTLAIIPIVAPAPGGSIQRIAISKDDKLVFTSDVTKPELAVIDTVTRKIRTRISLPSFGYGAAPTPDGRYLLVAIPAKNSVAVIDLKTLTVTRSIPTGAKPQEVLIRPDGRVAYVSCIDSASVTAINLADWQTSTLSAGPRADGLAWAK